MVSVLLFSEPFSTDAGPPSHRVRLWRGGSASKGLLHRLFFRRVRLHGHPEVCNGPWLLLWSRGEVDGAVLPKHSSVLVQCVVLPVTLLSP